MNRAKIVVTMYFEPKDGEENLPVEGFEPRQVFEAIDTQRFASELGIKYMGGNALIEYLKQKVVGR